MSLTLLVTCKWVRTASGSPGDHACERRQVLGLTRFGRCRFAAHSGVRGVPRYWIGVRDVL